MLAVEALVEQAKQQPGFVNALAPGSGRQVRGPGLPGCEPLLATAVQPSRIAGRTETSEAPGGGRLVEFLPGPLDDDHPSIGPKRVDDAVENDGRIIDVVERGR